MKVNELNYNHLDDDLKEKIERMIKKARTYLRHDSQVIEFGENNIVFIYDIDKSELKIVYLNDELSKKLEQSSKAYRGINNFPRWNEHVKRNFEEIQKDYKGFLRKLNDDIIKLYKTKRFKLRSEVDYNIVSSFVIASWVKEIFKTISYLIISGEMGSGKTTILKSIALLSYKSLISTNISLPALVRILDRHGTTVFIDEFSWEAFVKDKEFYRVLRSGINAGDFYARAKGDDVDVFDVFGFKVFALSFDKTLPLDIEDRSLRISTYRESFVVQEISPQELNDLLNRLSAFRIYALLNEDKFYNIITRIEYYLKGLDSRLAENLKYLFLFSNLSKEQLIEVTEKFNNEKKRRLTETDSYELLKALRDFIEIKLRYPISEGLKGLVDYFEKNKELIIFLSDFTKFYLSIKANIPEKDVIYKFPVGTLIDLSRKIRAALENKLGFYVRTKVSGGYTVIAIRPIDIEILKHLIKVFEEDRDVRKVVENAIKVIETYD